MDENKKEWLKSALELLIVAIVTYVVFTYIVKPVRVEGSSMMNTVESQDLTLMDAFGIQQNGVERFDVVIVECA